MKSLLLIAAAIILFLALPLIVWRLMDDPLERRITPIIGSWRSSLDPCNSLRIYIDDRGGCITRHRCSSRRSTTSSLQYGGCLYFIDTGGKRTDIFYSPDADVLLLMPGGTYQRITKNHQNHKNE